MTPTDGARSWVAAATLEELVTKPAFIGLGTASNAQRALCRCIDGIPLGPLAADADVRRLFGEGVDALPGVPPKEVTCLSGVRVFKSLLAAACAIRWSQRIVCPDWLGPGDIPRVAIMSLDKDTAAPVLSHLVGGILASPILRSIVVRGPFADGIDLRHPSGRTIEIRVVAGKRSGSAVVARWLAGVVFDEFPRLSGEGEYVVNWDESRRAAEARILPNGGILNIGSPYAPYGPAFEMATAHYGRPSQSLVVAWAPAWCLNPVYWTPERVEEYRRDKPDSYRTDVAAQFATPEEAFFSSDAIERSTRDGNGGLDRRAGASYAAYIDPATRANAFTCIVATREGNRLSVAHAAEWVGTRDSPLDTRVVLEQLRQILLRYGLETVYSDRYNIDSLSSQARELGFHVLQMDMSAQEKMERALCLRDKLARSEVELCEVQTVVSGGEQRRTRNLSLDLKRVRRLATQNGAVVKLPMTGDDRHCDFAPPMLMAVGAHLRDFEAQPTGVVDAETLKMRAEALARFAPPEDYDDE